MRENRVTIDGSESHRYDELAHVRGGEGYDWSDIALLRHRDSGQLFYASDGGCSCNYWWDYSVSAEPVATWQEWADRAQQWAAPGHEAEMAMEAIEKLNQERPAPSPKEDDQ